LRERPSFALRRSPVIQRCVVHGNSLASLTLGPLMVKYRLKRYDIQLDLGVDTVFFLVFLLAFRFLMSGIRHMYTNTADKTTLKFRGQYTIFRLGRPSQPGGQGVVAVLGHRGRVVHDLHQPVSGIIRRAVIAVKVVRVGNRRRIAERPRPWHRTVAVAGPRRRRGSWAQPKGQGCAVDLADGLDREKNSGPECAPGISMPARSAAETPRRDVHAPGEGVVGLVIAAGLWAPQ